MEPVDRRRTRVKTRATVTVVLIQTGLFALYGWTLNLLGWLILGDDWTGSTWETAQWPLAVVCLIVTWRRLFGWLVGAKS